jgi:hypothetical protein
VAAQPAQGGRQLRLPFDASDQQQVKLLSDFAALVTRLAFCVGISVGLASYISNKDLAVGDAFALTVAAILFLIIGGALSIAISVQVQNYIWYVFDVTNKSRGFSKIFAFSFAGVLYLILFSGAVHMAQGIVDRY